MFIHPPTSGLQPARHSRPAGPGLAGQERAAGKQTRPISSFPSDLSAEGKAQLSLDVLLFILLGFPARRAGA